MTTTDVSPPAGRRPTPRRKLSIRVAAWMRWLHIYLSMFGLAVILFFGVTGITLNHPDWFLDGAERRVEVEGKVKPEWLHRSPAPGAGTPADGQRDGSEQVDKLEVVEHLRRTHGIRGALVEFRVDESECMVTFKGPGYAADAFIQRDSGQYNLTESYHGLLALINDLHKGRDTGPVWSVLIDVSALLMAVVSLTGLVLLFYLKLRRGPGLVVALVGTLAAFAVYWLGVP
ncbi:PepSY-associated TM helix domain-containing protein [Singulisphaera sp. PoT]|uniref:PepSY-associated TM helix domain-containing protein n=1 Tax=Singulisphaera sp. PoT TaxID=3411797 RepID=UPI003BF52935